MHRARVALLTAIVVASTAVELPAASAAADVIVPSAATTQLNGDASVDAANVLTLTDAASDLSSAWYTTPVSLAQPFRVSFLYRARTQGPLNAPSEGFALVLQTSPAGLAALGTAGTGFPGHGYGGIPNSVALVVDVFETDETGLYQNGAGVGLPSSSDWNSQLPNGEWEHGVPGYPLGPGVDPDSTPPVFTLDGIFQSWFSSVGSAVVSYAADLGGFLRLYDHLYIGHGGLAVSGLDDGNWHPIQITVLPNLRTLDGSVAVRVEIDGQTSFVGYSGVREYWYLPGTPLPPDHAFFSGLPEHHPSPSPHYVGFTGSTGSFFFSEQSIRDWRIETGIDDSYWNYTWGGPERACGDLDLDGDVDADDARTLRRHLDAETPLSVDQSIACDVYAEPRAPGLEPDPADLAGQCSMADAAVIARHELVLLPGPAEVCPAGSAADCCAVHDGVGCNQRATVACVCLQDPSCCTAAWDPACAALACTTECAPTCDAPLEAYCDGACRDTETDLLHCGACDTPCDVPNASESCVAGACELGACDAGTCDGDGLPGTGCEVVLDDDPTCPGGLAGTVNGDASSTLGVGGSGEEMLRVRVLESLAAANVPLTASFSLTSPPGTDYDLVVRCLSCAAAPLSSPSDTVLVGRNDVVLTPQSYDVQVEVHYVSGSSCAPWQLTVTGGAATSNRSCD